MTTIPESVRYLTRAGIAHDDALALRKISMTLHRWHELECGTGEGHIERHPNTGKPFFAAYGLDRNHPGAMWQIADREAGAKRRLAKILAKYPGWQAYIQGDPRGCALYMLRPGDVREGQSIDSCYTNGIAVYK